MNQHIIFDRTRYTDKLRDNGVDEKTARAHSEALDGALRDAVATKTDLQNVEKSLESDIRKVEQTLQSAIRNVEQSLKDEMHELEGRMNKQFVEIDGKFADINIRFAEMNTKFAEQSAKTDTGKLEMIRWMIGTQIAMAGLIIGVLLKFMK